MSHKFKIAEYLDDNKTVRVVQVTSDFVTVRSRMVLGADWFQYFKAVDYDFLTASYQPDPYCGDVGFTHFTTFRRVLE